MMMDTETANTLMREDGSLDMTSVFVYDIGWQVTDKRGFLYEQKSYIVKEIFFDEAALMKSAYYASKIPQYLKDIAEGKRIVASYYDIRKDFIETMQRYETNTVCAHNARFDYNATNTTERWLTKSKYRFFLPYGTEVWDTLKMARDVVSHTPTYIKFCEENGFMTKHKTPRPRLTAEILYRYITGNLEFEESHTGLEDVDIERQILAYCFAKHKAMAKDAWEQSHYTKEIEVND
jgi:DNA polymerase III epsilon subunit-like protein